MSLNSTDCSGGWEDKSVREYFYHNSLLYQLGHDVLRLNLLCCLHMSTTNICSIRSIRIQLSVLVTTINLLYDPPNHFITRPDRVVDYPHIVSVPLKVEGLPDVGQIVGVRVHGHHLPVHGGHHHGVHAEIGSNVWVNEFQCRDEHFLAYQGKWHLEICSWL